MTAVIIRMVLAFFAILSCEGVLDAQAAFPTATVNISGTESYQDGVWDQRDIRIDFNGFVETVAYGQFSSSQSVAAAFAAKFSADYHSFGLYAKAGAPGTAPSVITFELTDGSNFGSLNVVDSATSFSLSSSGFTPTSSAQADIGVASLTINGAIIAVNYGSGSTASSIAQDLAANAHSSSSPVEVTSDGPNLYLRANASGGNFSYPYSLSFSSNQSFSTSNMSSGTLTSGSQVSPSIVYSYSVEDAKGHNGYQANGNLQNVADSVMGSWTYTYDRLNRLIKGTSASGVYSGRYLCWNYDTFGNRLSQSVSTTSCSANPPSTYSAAFNAKNQVNTVTTPANGSVTYDLAGNVTNDGTHVYVYDAEERICVVQGPEGMIGYQYNSDGIRVGKGTVTSMSSCDPAQNGYVPVSDYILDQDGDQLTEMSVTNGTATWLHTDVRANGSLVATYDTTGDGLHFYLNDAVGTRRVQTNAAGVPEQRCQSLPFGDQLYCSGSIEIPTEHHYTGKERDTESGLDYFGARYYSSNMGRWMSPDAPFADQHPDNPQSWNMYSYTRNNPLSAVDPDGRAVEVLTALALQRVQSTVPADVRSQVTADKNGMLNRASIDAIKSTDSNVMLLKQAVDLSSTIEVTTGTSVQGGQPSGADGVVGVPFEYQSVAAQQAVVTAAGGDASSITTPSVYDGYTQTAAQSPSGNIRVTVADGTGATSTEPAAGLASTTAHELYGHALPNAQGKPYQHDNGGPVDQSIKKIEDHTKKLNQPQQ